MRSTCSTREDDEVCFAGDDPRDSQFLGNHCRCPFLCFSTKVTASCCVRSIAMRPLSCSLAAVRPARPLLAQTRTTLLAPFRQRSTASEANVAPATKSLSPRWLADVKQRLGKCITFGLKPEQTVRAGAVLDTVARDWRELVAGSEGFLTSEDRRGFYRHAVVWGEMDSMVGICFSCRLKTWD